MQVAGGTPPDPHVHQFDVPDQRAVMQKQVLASERQRSAAHIIHNGTDEGYRVEIARGNYGSPHSGSRSSGNGDSARGIRAS